MMPTRIRITPPNPKPTSDDTSFSKEWSKDHEEVDLNTVLNSWRRQDA